MWSSLGRMKVEIRELVVRGDRSVAKGRKAQINMCFCETNPIGIRENSVVTCVRETCSGGGRENLNPVRFPRNTLPLCCFSSRWYQTRSRSMSTAKLTIRGAGGSIVAQSCQERVGDVAQLVERRNGIAEATGSTPVVSTNPFFGPFGRVSKSLAFFLNSVTLTRLRRRTALLGQKRHEQQHSEYWYYCAR